MGCMPFSGDIYVLNKLAELAQRFGVSPALANFELKLRFPEDIGRPESDDYHYFLGMIDGNEVSAQEEENMQKMASLLGLDGSWHGEFPRLTDVEKAVDHALSLAPRARSRQKT